MILRDDFHMRPFLLLLALAIAGHESMSAAQSLAEIARKEEARRNAVTVPGKVYSNSDLKPEPSKDVAPLPSDPSATQPRPSASVAADAVPGGAVDQPPKEKGEAYWRALINGARAALERSKALADALQSRLNALATDIVSRDDPAQRAELARERERALVMLEKLKAEIDEQTKAIAGIEEEARRAGVPPGWLR